MQPVCCRLARSRRPTLATGDVVPALGVAGPDRAGSHRQQSPEEVITEQRYRDFTGRVPESPSRTDPFTLVSHYLTN